MSSHREGRPRRPASRAPLRLRPPSPRPASPRPALSRPASRRAAVSRPVSSRAPSPASLPLTAPAGPPFAGALLARLASAASASASCSSRGRETSLARIAALSVTFIAGTSSSSSRQCHPKHAHRPPFSRSAHHYPSRTQSRHHHQFQRTHQPQQTAKGNRLIVPTIRRGQSRNWICGSGVPIKPVRHHSGHKNHASNKNAKAPPVFVADPGFGVDPVHHDPPDPPPGPDPPPKSARE
jgi:hypothetical protein